jgi:hypothetical protein
MNKRELFPYSNRGSQLYVVEEGEQERSLIRFFFSCAVSFLRLPENSKRKENEENVLWHAIFQNHE